MFGAVKLVTNTDIDKNKYSGYDIGSDRCGTFSIATRFSRNVVIFGADISCSLHVDNKKKDILVLGKGPIQQLDGT